MEQRRRTFDFEDVDEVDDDVRVGLGQNQIIADEIGAVLTRITRWRDNAGRIRENSSAAGAPPQLNVGPSKSFQFFFFFNVHLHFTQETN